LPLPAQVKLGGRVAVLESHLPPPPPPALLDIDASANDNEETGSVRAEDILAALAVEDLEPATDVALEAEPNRGAEPESEPISESEPEPAEPAVASAPISSGRRAPLTAVVVPSVLAGPDATFTPVPSVLQTLRGPGVPPLGADALGLAPEWVAAGALAPPDNVNPVAAAQSPISATPSSGVTPARAWSMRLDHAVDAARAARKRMPGSLVAAVGGTALLLSIALVSAAGGKGESSSGQPSKLLAAQRADGDRTAAAEQKRTAQRAPPPNAETSSGKGETKPPTADASRGETGADDLARQAATARDEAAARDEEATARDEATSALAVAAVVAPRRAVASKPARRASAAARATAPATKKKKIRATRKYIPSGI
ncbi:MAG TPA: hypothetical protein VI197_28425, partial [Polyangiaceae bacterium]